MEIVGQIQNSIRQGKLKRGDKLPPERTLAEHLGVSRPPLREALAALEILGVIDSRGGRGSFIVNTFDSAFYVQQLKELEETESPLELLEARKVIEGEVTALAAERRSLSDVRELSSIIKRMESAVGNVSEFVELNRRFHLEIGAATHNAALYQMMKYIIDEVNKKLWTRLDENMLMLPGRTNKYFRQHREILESIKAKDKARARKTALDSLASFEIDIFGEDGQLEI